MEVKVLVAVAVTDGVALGVFVDVLVGVGVCEGVDVYVDVDVAVGRLPEGWNSTCSNAAPLTSPL